MITKLQSILNFLIYEVMRRLYWRPFKRSFSQNQEDLVIDKLLGYKDKGFYVDVGAYDPDRMSNTRRFYLRGWRGINIEPNPQNFQKFLQERSRDINLNLGVSDIVGTLTFYQFFPSALSTFSQKDANFNQKQGFKLLREFPIQVDTLANILDKYTPEQEIDFFSVDTEGFDLKVLKGNDWERFGPKLVCVETGSLGQDREVDKFEKTAAFLKGIGYRLVYRNSVNSIFQKK